MAKGVSSQNVWRYEDRYAVCIERDGVGWLRLRNDRGWTGPWIVVR